MDVDTLLSFISLVLLSAGLGIDNGLLIEFSLRSLKLEEKKHLVWRSAALIMAALLRILFLFSLSQFTFLNDPQPDHPLLVNKYFSKHPEDLTWMSFVLFFGGVIILVMALWEYYHKLNEARHGDHENQESGHTGTFKLVAVIMYLSGMNILFSLDSVFAAVAIMDLDTQFWWMVAAILIAAAIMIFGMIPLSKIIAKNKHFGVLMLTVLAVIAVKLLVDGTGAHFSNGLLLFIIGLLLANDAAQAGLDAAYKGRKSPK